MDDHGSDRGLGGGVYGRKTILPHAWDLSPEGSYMGFESGCRKSESDCLPACAEIAPSRLTGDGLCSGRRAGTGAAPMLAGRRAGLRASRRRPVHGSDAWVSFRCLGMLAREASKGSTSRASSSSAPPWSSRASCRRALPRDRLVGAPRDVGGLLDRRVRDRQGIRQAHSATWAAV